MNEMDLKMQIKSAAKTANSRIRRAKQAGLPTSSTERLQTAVKMNSKLVTKSGFVSASTKGLTEKQMQQKLKWIRGIIDQTETVEKARERVKNKAKEWDVSEKVATKRLESGRIFAQILNDYESVFNSDVINKTISEFAKMPTYGELERALFEKYGRDMQDFVFEREALRDWINDNNIIPDGVDGKFVDDKFLYDDEIDEIEDEEV